MMRTVTRSVTTASLLQIVSVALGRMLPCLSIESDAPVRCWRLD